MAFSFRQSLLAGAALLAVAVAVPASAQTSADVDNRLRRLENELQTLNRAVYKGDMPDAPPASGPDGGQAMTNIEVRLSQIETDMQTLTGKVEQQNYDMGQLQKTVSDLGVRVQQLEGRAGALAGSAAPAPGGMYGQPPQAVPQPQSQPGFAPAPEDYGATPPQPRPAGQGGGAFPSEAPRPLGTLTEPAAPGGLPAKSVTDDPASMYDHAYALVRDRDYEAAGKELQAFIDRYPDHDLSPNAMYWLGETYYVRADYQHAARTFAEAYKKYPKGPKGPDNLLKLGMSLAGMGKKSDACVALAQISHEYPTGAGPVLSRAEQEMQTLGCK